MLPTQTFTGETVVEAARRRIGFIFDHFEEVKLSISGGKDSTVLAHLVLLEAQRRGRRVGMFFLDEEVVYQSTVEQVTYLMEELAPECVIPLWVQIEFNLTNATSTTETQLVCWEAGKHELWMRPRKQGAIWHRTWALEDQTVRDKNKGFGFYDALENFERCYSGNAWLVGLRATESPNRWRAVTKNPVVVDDTPIYWATPKAANTAFYPLYDWNFHDVWRYIYDQGLRYSKIYDYQFRKGLPLNEMRVSSLIHERSFKAICELPEFEPQTYERLVRRLKGIEFAQETGKDAKMFRVRKLPQNFSSWRAYRDFLIATHLDPEKCAIMARRFSRHLDNEYVARQQCRQLVLNDYENNLPVDNKPDPRDELIAYYWEVL